jgi:adenylate kinase
MKLIFLGPPGAGKGTLAAKAATAFGIPHISTGDLFRAAIKNATPLGLEVKGILASGALVPDSTTIALVKERLAAEDAKAGWILDGFPRTIPQAEALDSFAPSEKVVDFSISDEQVVERLSGRRVCKGCGKNYNERFMPPAKSGVCDTCGSELFIRDDDKKEAIEKRLEVYRVATEPLIEYYRMRGSFVSVDAGADAETVFAELSMKLKGTSKNP